MPFRSIDSIVVDRQLRPDDNVDTLAKSILDQGMKYPVLILENGILVDGLRRIEAAKLAGFTTIEVVTALTMEDATEALAISHRDTPHGRLDYPPWRIFQIWRKVTKLPRRTAVINGGLPSRTLVREALHLSSDNLIQSTVFTYKTAEEGGPLGDVARAAIKMIDAGEINGYGGRLRIYAKRESLSKADTSMTKARARQLFIQAAANIAATARGFQLVPEGLEVEALDVATARAVYYELDEARMIISNITGRLSRIARSEETHK